MEFEAVIGLEIHAELNTKTKMYCSCENAFGGKVNSRICPICTGHPGVLPSLNGEAVKKAILAGKMMNCTIAAQTKQYRKHYRYPDLPKGYQISQLTLPLCYEGYFDYFCNEELKRAYIRQIHIEEDAGKLIHSGESTFVDYNRCGVPLIEIVTNPCFNSSDEAVAFMESVRTMLLDIGISDCRMEEGSLRADVNVSLRKKGETTLNARVEMKNLATFSGARRAIDYEIARQSEIMARGDSVAPLTMRWDDELGKSFFMRDKESMADYRFMPEPDIPPIIISEFEYSLPKSEAERRVHLLALLPSAQAREIARDLKLYNFLMATDSDVKIAANLLLGHIAQLSNKTGIMVWDTPLTPDKLCEIISRMKNGEITGDGAKELMDFLYKKDGEVGNLISELNLAVTRDEGKYTEIINAVICDNEKAVSDFKSGKESAVGFLVGQCMRRAGKGAEATRFQTMLLDKLRR